MDKNGILEWIKAYQAKKDELNALGKKKIDGVEICIIDVVAPQPYWVSVTAGIEILADKFEKEVKKIEFTKTSDAFVFDHEGYKFIQLIDKSEADG